MLRARHLPYRIDEAAQEVWLGGCKRMLENALAAYVSPPSTFPLCQLSRRVSSGMVNAE